MAFASSAKCYSTLFNLGVVRNVASGLEEIEYHVSCSEVHVAKIYRLMACHVILDAPVDDSLADGSYDSWKVCFRWQNSHVLLFHLFHLLLLLLLISLAFSRLARAFSGTLRRFGYKC